MLLVSKMYPPTLLFPVQIILKAEEINPLPGFPSVFFGVCFLLLFSSLNQQMMINVFALINMRRQIRNRAGRACSCGVAGLNRDEGGEGARERICLCACH